MDTGAASSAAAAASYKQRKEAFVSGLSGGSVAEINYVVAVGPVRAESRLPEHRVTAKS